MFEKLKQFYHHNLDAINVIAVWTGFILIAEFFAWTASGSYKAMLANTRGTFQVWLVAIGLLLITWRYSRLPSWYWAGAFYDVLVVIYGLVFYFLFGSIFHCHLQVLSGLFFGGFFMLLIGPGDDEEEDEDAGASNDESEPVSSSQSLSKLLTKQLPSTDKLLGLTLLNKGDDKRKFWLEGNKLNINITNWSMKEINELLHSLEKKED